MKYLVDHQALLAVVEGQPHVIEGLAGLRKCDVVVPEPVILTVARETKRIARPGAAHRWSLLMPALPRMAWTEAVTEKLIALGTPARVTPLDLAVAAHALAAGLEVVTCDVDRFAWLPALRVSPCL